MRVTIIIGAMASVMVLGCEQHQAPSVQVIDVGTGEGLKAGDAGVNPDAGSVANAIDAGFTLDSGNPEHHCGPISQVELVQKLYGWAGLQYCGNPWINHQQYCPDSNPANWPGDTLCQRRGLQHELHPANPLGNCRRDYVVTQGRFANTMAALLGLEDNQRRLGQLPVDEPTFSNIGRDSAIQAAVNYGLILLEDGEEDGRFLAQKSADSCWVDQVLSRRNAGATGARVELVGALPNGETVEELNYEFRSASQWPDGRWELGSLFISSERTGDFRRRLKLNNPDIFLVTFPSFDGYRVAAAQIDAFEDAELLEISCPGTGVLCFAVPAVEYQDLGVKVELRAGTLTRLNVQFER